MQASATEQRYSIGGAAKLLQVSPSLLRKLELQGIIPPAPRLAGSDRRVYTRTDIEAIKAAREAARGQPPPDE